MNSANGGESKPSKIPGQGARPPKQFYGLALVVATLREMDPVTRLGITKELQQKMPLLASLVDHCDFIFSDFKLLDDASLFNAFTRFGDKDWAVAWKLMDDALKTRVLNLLRDERRKEFLDFAAGQPKMPRNQVLAVQFHLARQTRDLLRMGKFRMSTRAAGRLAEIKRNNIQQKSVQQNSIKQPQGRKS